MDSPQSECQDLKISVFNLSSQNLTDGEISLFKLGTNFVPVTKVSALETKVDILRFSRRLLLKAKFHDSNFSDESLVNPPSCYIPKEVKSKTLKGIIEDLEIFANDFPNNVNNVLVKDNMSIEQRIGLGVFKQRKNILYFRADKGSGVVLLNEPFYKDKILNILNSNKYEKLPRNVDYFVNLKLKTFVKKYKDMLTSSERRAIVNFDYKTTNIYGLPKIHKSKIIEKALPDNKSGYLHICNPKDLSFRLIFGGPKNPCSVLADFLNTILNPFRSKVCSSLRDVFDFIRSIPQFCPEDLPFVDIVSVDVISMYENLTQKLGLPALRFYLTKYNNLLPKRFSINFILEAMTFVLNNNTGFFNGEIYKQLTGTATGIKPAPPYADLAMGYLEIQLHVKLRAKMGKKVAGYFRKFYRRFLDDGIIFWDERVGNFNEVFTLLNAIDPDISFTMERNSSNLKFLDILIYKTTTGFNTVVQSKNTDSESVLNFNSSHPRHCKENIPFSMARRVKALTDDETLVDSQMKILSNKLLKANYPLGLVRSAIQSAKALSTTDLRKPRLKTNDSVLPFVHTYDPSITSLLKEIKNLTSRLFTSIECRSIFGDTKVIASRREPPSILKQLQHSRFDDSGRASFNRGVSRCGMRACETCSQIIETDTIFFKNASLMFNINSKMDCTARNVVYALFCNGCDKYYIGETVNLRNRASSHRSNSKVEDRAVMEVSKHVLICNKSFKICPIYKIKEECKILRLVIEDNLIKLLKPDLNADRRNLLHLN